MTTNFARFNIQLEPSPDLEAKVTNWEAVLSEAAHSGYADDFEFFYIAEKRVIGINIPFEVENPMSLLEAGSVLGYVHKCYEASDIPTGASWLSIHDSKDTTLDTPYIPQ